METAFGSLKRVAFRAETTSRVKDLRGFSKSFGIPDRSTPSAQKFIARLATEEIKNDIDETFQAIRDSFGFKRKQVESSTDEDGTGVIQTPQFEYSISVVLDPADPGQLIWRREVTGLQDAQVIRGPAFQTAFGTIFHALFFEFADPIDVIDLVDRLEEDEAPGVRIRCDSSASQCDITLAGFPGSIRITPTSLTVEGRHAPSAASLLDQFLGFLARFPGARELPALQ